MKYVPASPPCERYAILYTDPLPGEGDAMPEKLKACPHCDRYPKEGYYDGPYAYCETCHGGADLDVWNRRPREEALEKQRERLVALLRKARARIFLEHFHWSSQHEKYDMPGDELIAEITVAIGEEATEAKEERRG